jgi:hypothetical protein
MKTTTLPFLSSVRPFLGFFSLALLLSMLASFANASPIRAFTFTSVVRYGPIGLGYPTAGTVLTGAFAYDMEAIEEANYPNSYGNAVASFSIDGLLSKKEGGGSVVAISNNIGNPILDQFTMFLDVAGPTIDGISPLQFLMRLRDEDGVPDMFSSNALPDTLQFSSFDNSYFELSTSKGNLVGSITGLQAVSTVPEPETFGLILIGLVAIGAVSLRRAGKRQPA